MPFRSYFTSAVLVRCLHSGSFSSGTLGVLHLLMLYPSSLSASINLPLGLHLFLLPGTLISSILLPTYSSSLFLTYLTHHDSGSLALSQNYNICVVSNVIVSDFLHSRRSHKKIATLNFSTSIAPYFFSLIVPFSYRTA